MAKIWKVEIRYDGCIVKKKFYEREKDFNKWFPAHKKEYEEYGNHALPYTVKGFVAEASLKK
jgi:hypothetical protein